MATKHVSARLLFRWLYEDISREKAEELLMLPSNHEGSFLIRKSQMIKGIGGSPLKSDKKTKQNKPGKEVNQDKKCKGKCGISLFKPYALPHTQSSLQQATIKLLFKTK